MRGKREFEEELEDDESLWAGLKDQDLGTHMCCIYKEKGEQLSALSKFMSLGIERNEKCFYIVDDRTKDEVIEAFESTGFDVEEFLESNQFEFLTKSESYLKDDYFDPDEMISFLEEAENQALDEGYAGLRVTGEMTWIFSDVPGVERLMEYESKLNELISDNKIIALCQYNEEKFPPELLVDMLRTHSKVLIYDDLHENPHYMPPKIFKAQLRGEVTWEHYENMKENIIQRTRMKRKEEDLNKELRKSEEEKSLILENTPALILYQDLNHEIIWANERAGKSVNENSSDLVGRKCYEIWHDRGEACEDCPVEKAWEAGKVERREVASPDGRFWLITGAPIRNEDGNITGAVEISLNITDRKGNGIDVEKAKKSYQELFEKSAEALFVHDVETGEVIDVNQKAYEMYGASKGDFREEIFSKFSSGEHPYTKENALKKIRKAKDEVQSFEWRAKRKNGELFWAEVSLKPIEVLGEERILASVRDITERKEAKESLEMAMNAGGIAFWDWDMKEDKVEFDENWEEMIGYDLDELGEDISVWKDLIHPEDIEKVKEELGRHLSGETSLYEVIPRMKTKDGEWRYFVDAGKVVEWDENDNPRRFIGILRDVTDRMKAERRKEFLNTLLRQDLRSKNQSIQAYQQLIGEADLSEKHRGYLSNAIEAAEELDEILGLANKLEEIEETDWDYEKNIFKVLEHSIEDVFELVETEEIEIEKNYPKSIGRVKGDYSLDILLSQILKTRIQTTGCESIKINAKEREEYILIRIEDDGKQLPDDIKNLFAGEIYTGETTGFGGVRYYMFREIAEHNKAKIEVKDSELGGARFDIQLQKA